MYIKKYTKKVGDKTWTYEIAVNPNTNSVEFNDVICCNNNLFSPCLIGLTEKSDLFENIKEHERFIEKWIEKRTAQFEIEKENIVKLKKLGFKNI